ncbi:MAG: hypothetical protein KAR14_05810, partial [Candidatus Aminicenantes bacterium]|nr:hypothetical protein [Candidatus Aminicenantes bacterium]
MIKRILLIGFILIFALIGLAQDKGADTTEIKSDVPEKVQLSLDGLLKTRTSNNVYSLKLLDTYYYVLQKSVFVNILFTADLDAKIEELEKVIKDKFDVAKDKYDKYVTEMEKRTAEENIKIEEKNKIIKDDTKKVALNTFNKPQAPVYNKRKSYHNLYLRVIKDGAEYQKFKSLVPYEGSGDLEYLSFGLILEPGKYDLLVVVDAFDNSEDGTLLAEIEVPKLTLSDIAAPKKNVDNSRPVFYKKVSTLLEAEKRFTVVKNNYQIGIVKQKFSPYTGHEYKFKSGDTPILTFFLKGAKMVQTNPPWDLIANISILKGKKKVSVFKPVKLQNPYFFQPVKIIGKKNKELEEGEYSLLIE